MQKVAMYRARVKRVPGRPRARPYKAPTRVWLKEPLSGGSLSRIRLSAIRLSLRGGCIERPGRFDISTVHSIVFREHASA